MNGIQRVYSGHDTLATQPIRAPTPLVAPYLALLPEETAQRRHDLRHSFASHAAARSETVPMIGRLLGHARVASTARYTHFDDADVRNAAFRIGEVIETMMTGKALEGVGRS